MLPILWALLRSVKQATIMLSTVHSKPARQSAGAVAARAGLTLCQITHLLPSMGVCVGGALGRTGSTLSLPPFILPQLSCQLSPIQLVMGTTKAPSAAQGLARDRHPVPEHSDACRDLGT